MYTCIIHLQRVAGYTPTIVHDCPCKFTSHKFLHPLLLLLLPAVPITHNQRDIDIKCMKYSTAYKHITGFLNMPQFLHGQCPSMNFPYLSLRFPFACCCLPPILLSSLFSQKQHKNTMTKNEWNMKYYIIS